MKYILDLLNKIKWDKRESPEDYVIGYEDRVSKEIIEVKFTDIKRIEGNFMIIEKNLEEVSIPLHRIRVVKKNSSVVWERPMTHEGP